jgi:spermidine synthase
MSITSTRSTARRAPRRSKAAADIELPDATLSEFDGVRYLHLGDTPWVQGAMRVRQPRSIELEYVQRMLVWLLWRDPQTIGDDLHAVQLGLGAAALTRHCHSVLKLRTSAVELNAQVVAACRQWFHLPADDERLQVHVADAGAWVAEAAHWGTADVLNVDLYDHQAAAPVLDDEGFYRHCHAVLNDHGVMTVNLFGRNASFARSARRIAATFGEDHVRMLSPTKEGNTIVLAWKGAEAPPRELLQQRAEVVEARWELPATKWLRLIKPLPRPKPAELTDATAATDATDPSASDDNHPTAAA